MEFLGHSVSIVKVIIDIPKIPTATFQVIYVLMGKKTTYVSVHCEIKLNSYIYGRGARVSSAGTAQGGSRYGAAALGRVLLRQPVYSWCLHQCGQGSHADKVTCLPLLGEASVMPPQHIPSSRGLRSLGPPQHLELWGQDHKATGPHIPKGRTIYFSTSSLRAPVS